MSTRSSTAKMKTTFQTVDLTIPGSHMTFQTMAEYPLPPPEIAEHLRISRMPRGLKMPDAYFYWFPDGKAEVHRSNGNTEVYWPVPTIQEAIHYGRPNCDCCPKKTGYFFQYHKDGSVTCDGFGAKYYWSAPFEGEPIGVSDHSNLLVPYLGENGWYFHYNDRDLIEQKWNYDDDDYDDGYSSDDSYMTYDSEYCQYRRLSHRERTRRLNWRQTNTH